MSVYDGYSLLKINYMNSTSISLNNRNIYYLRAEDSGLTVPGYVYWKSYSVDYSDAPVPVGTYSNLLILKITNDDYVSW